MNAENYNFLNKTKLQRCKKFRIYLGRILNKVKVIIESKKDAGLTVSFLIPDGDINSAFFGFFEI